MSHCPWRIGYAFPQTEGFNLVSFLLKQSKRNHQTKCSVNDYGAYWSKLVERWIILFFCSFSRQLLSLNNSLLLYLSLCAHQKLWCLQSKKHTRELETLALSSQTSGQASSVAGSAVSSPPMIKLFAKFKHSCVLLQEMTACKFGSPVVSCFLPHGLHQAAVYPFAL